MDIGIVGLGKMGANMARRLASHQHRVVGYNRSPGTTNELASEHVIEPAYSLEELVSKLPVPRAVWVMVPSGEPTDQTVLAISKLLTPDEVIIDGGNSFYQDSIRRAGVIQAMGLHYLDVGTSGGIWGLTEGYSMMIGGEPEIVERLRPIFESLAPGPNLGWGRVGPHGAGHFVKMVHNGIEYGMMQAYAEGFELMRAKSEFELDLAQIAEVWRYGSVVRSWLLDLAARALEDDPELSDIKGWVADSGEGRWTAKESIDLAVPAPVITLALQARFASRQEESYAAKLLAALRHQFGGHAIKSSD